MNVERFHQARSEFDLKYRGKRRYAFVGPALAIGQGALLLSQFSAISTFASAKVRQQQPAEASLLLSTAPTPQHTAHRCNCP